MKKGQFQAISFLLFLACVSCSKQAKITKSSVATNDSTPHVSKVTQEELQAVFLEDPTFYRNSVQDFFSITFQDEQLGWSLWQEAQTLHQNTQILMSEALLRVAAKPWLRPILMDALEFEMISKSQQLKHDFSTHSFQSLTRRYNLIILGAGPNSALAALKMHQRRPDLKIAQIEQHPLPATPLRKLGLSSWLGSPESPDESPYEFSSLSLTAKHLMDYDPLLGDFFIAPEVLSDLTTIAAFKSGADVVLNSEVTAIATIPERNQLRVTLIDQPSENRTSLDTEQVWIANRLNPLPSFDTTDPDSLNLIRGSRGLPSSPPELAPPIEIFEEITDRATRIIRQNRMRPHDSAVSFLTPYVGKTVAVVGAGDRGNMLLEILGGFAPPEVYGQETLADPQPGMRPGPRVGEPTGVGAIIWLGQEYSTRVDFINHNNRRFLNTVPHLLGQTQSLNLRLQTLQEIRTPSPSAAHDSLSFRIQLSDPSSPLLVADYIWFASEHLSPAIHPLAENLRTARLHTFNASDLNIQTERIEALSDQLAQMNDYFFMPFTVGQNLLLRTRLSPPAEREPISATDYPLIQNYRRLTTDLPKDATQKTAYTKIALKTLLSRTFQRVTLDLTEKLTVRLEYLENPNRIRIQTSGLNSPSKNWLLNRLRENTALLSLIQNTSAIPLNSVCVQVAPTIEASETVHPQKIEILLSCPSL